MPFPANEAHRSQFPKTRYQVKNWREYDPALQQRGSLTLWITPEAFAAWPPTLLNVSLAVPDHTTFSRRSISLSLTMPRARSREPVHVVLDSTGLKIDGAGEWQREKHGERRRRTWRKLHLAINPDNSEILASELTSHEVGDPSRIAPLLNQIPESIASVLADGA